MADQLGYDHWFPRVNLLHIDERRGVDTVPNCPTTIALWASRNGTPSGEKFYSGPRGTTGEVRITVPVPAGAAGKVTYTRCFAACDQFGVVDAKLQSNVFEIRIVP